MEQPPSFTSLEDECRYWKERAKFYHKEWVECKQDYDEFEDNSRQLEAEMEATIQQKEKAMKDLRKQVLYLEKDNESLRIKLDSNGIENSNLEKQLESVSSEREKLKSYCRQLEQKNDDLERAHRILSESIAGIESMLDKAYEKNALLEMEVDEKEVLQEKLQRLMDETRDLKQELNVQNLHTSPSTNSLMSNGTSLNNTTAALSNHTSTAINDCNSLRNPENILNGNGVAIPASNKSSALNVVAEMLRKLNGMESKLTAYRLQVRQHHAHPKE